MGFVCMSKIARCESCERGKRKCNATCRLSQRWWLHRLGSCPQLRIHKGHVRQSVPAGREGEREKVNGVVIGWFSWLCNQEKCSCTTVVVVAPNAKTRRRQSIAFHHYHHYAHSNVLQNQTIIQGFD